MESKITHVFTQCCFFFIYRYLESKILDKQKTLNSEYWNIFTQESMKFLYIIYVHINSQITSVLTKFI
jgi:hypothetical protein